MYVEVFIFIIKKKFFAPPDIYMHEHACLYNDKHKLKYLYSSRPIIFYQRN
jgi:hypothetical protein